MSLRGALVAIAVPLLFVAGCGEDGGDADTTAEESPAPSSGAPSSGSSTSATPAPSHGEDQAAPPEAPDCTEVWQSDAKLPAPYVGCYEGEEFVAPTQQMCGFGKPLVTYGDSFYAVPGGTIHETPGALQQDAQYTKDLKACQA